MRYDRGRHNRYDVRIYTNENNPILWRNEIREKFSFEFKNNLSIIGIYILMTFEDIPRYYPNAKIENIVVMPDCIHMMILIKDEYNEADLPRIINQVKGYITKKMRFKIWANSYSKRLVCGRQDFEQTRKCIEQECISFVRHYRFDMDN